MWITAGTQPRRRKGGQAGNPSEPWEFTERLEQDYGVAMSQTIGVIPAQLDSS